MAGVMSYEDFYAIHDHMPGADGALRVGGTVVFRTGGWSAQLRLHEKQRPTGINPFILYVDLIITSSRFAARNRMGSHWWATHTLTPSSTTIRYPCPRALPFLLYPHRPSTLKR
jgi:hypothetical protein